MNFSMRAHGKVSFAVNLPQSDVAILHNIFPRYNRKRRPPSLARERWVGGRSVAEDDAQRLVQDVDLRQVAAAFNCHAQRQAETAVPDAAAHCRPGGGKVHDIVGAIVAGKLVLLFA